MLIREKICEKQTKIFYSGKIPSEYIFLEKNLSEKIISIFTGLEVLLSNKKKFVIRTIGDSDKTEKLVESKDELKIYRLEKIWEKQTYHYDKKRSVAILQSVTMKTTTAEAHKQTKAVQKQIKEKTPSTSFLKIHRWPSKNTTHSFLRNF